MDTTPSPSVAPGPKPKEYAAELTLMQQAAALKWEQPDSTIKFHKPSELTWIGQIRPTPLNENYTVKITLGLLGCPRIWVIAPALRKRGEEDIPHMYAQERLCVYNPSKYQWNRKMKLSETILVWTSMWLYFYEIWQATGLWLGGGDHPEPEKGSPSKKREGGER